MYSHSLSGNLASVPTENRLKLLNARSGRSVSRSAGVQFWPRCRALALTVVRCLRCGRSGNAVRRLLGRGRAIVESCGGGENSVQRGYFHDPISIRETKLFMWSA